MIEDKALSGPLAERYAGWNSAEAKAMLAGERSLEQIAAREGSRDLPRPVRRRRCAVQFIEIDYIVGRWPRLQGGADPDAGTRACSIFRRLRRRKPIATRSRASAPMHGVEITELSTHLQGQLVAVHPAYDAQFDGFAPDAVRGNPKARQAMGGRADEARRQGVAESRAHGLHHLHRRARVALSLPLAAAAGRPDRRGLRRARQALDARSSTPMTRPASTSATRSIPARTPSTAPTFEMFLDASAATSVATSTTTRRISCCSSSTISPSSTSTTSASRRSTSRTPSSTRRPPGRLLRLPGLGRTAPGRFRSLGDGQVDFTGIFSKLAQYGYDSWAVLEWECCLKHPEDGAAEGAPVHRKPHHPRHREGVRRFRRRDGTDELPPR
jgi:hypothetical protein